MSPSLKYFPRLCAGSPSSYQPNKFKSQKSKIRRSWGENESPFDCTRIIKSPGICDDEVLYRHADSPGLPEVSLSSILHLVRSRHVNSRAYKIYWASYLEDGALVRISILFFLLITHAGDLSSAGKVRVSRFFWESQQEVDICKDWSETLSVDLSVDSSIYPTYGVSQRHKRHQLVTEATKCE